MTARLGKSWPAAGAFLVLAVAPLVLTDPCGASVIEQIMAEEGLPVAEIEGPGSTRLDGMGRLELVIPDENNEINLLDYGGNLAGTIFDKDHWSLETWTRYHNLLLDPRDPTRRRFRFLSGGTRVVYRKADQRAIGAAVNYQRLEASPVTGDDVAVRGPVTEAFYNERPFSWLAAAVSLGLNSENEDRVSEDVFSVRHRQGRIEGQVGLAFLLGSYRLGATWDFRRGEITGTSRDPAAFHSDQFVWKRPEDTFSAQAVFLPDGPVRGGAFVRRKAFEGGETARLRWSDRFPDNGSRENFALETTSFLEEEESTTYGTRWFYELGATWRLGGLLSGASGSTLVTEGVNFKGSRRAGETDFDSRRLGAGASGLFLDRRLQAGVEAYLERGDLTESSVRAAVDRSWQTRSLRVGAEMFWTKSFVVRGGLVTEDLDLDVDRPASRHRGFLYTLGASYLPRGGLWQLDGALGLERRRRAQEDNEESVLEDVFWSFGVRHIL